MILWFRLFRLLRGNAAIYFRGSLFLFLAPSLAICVTDALLRECDNTSEMPYSRVPILHWFIYHPNFILYRRINFRP
jgi:hypothetical protein